MKKRRLENMLVATFIIIGIAFLIVGTTVIESLKKNKENYLQTEGVIVDIDENQNVQVSYVVDEIEYIGYLNSYIITYREGKTITIYYDINDPTNISSDLDQAFLYIWSGIGLLFILISGGIVLSGKLNEKKKQRLKQSGNIANAKYLCTEINKRYAINNKHPYNVICELDSSIDGKTHILKSENIWFDPKNIIEDRNITTFRVYYNINNLKQYYIDIDILFDKNIF